MRVNGGDFRTIWLEPDSNIVRVIDQRLLPHRFEVLSLHTVADAERAIATMVVRGAPLIGATAAYGVALAMLEDPSDDHLASDGRLLMASRPTAVNLAWAVRRMQQALGPFAPADRAGAAFVEAARICDEDVASCQAIGRWGADRLIQHRRADRPLQILTHCNAGWLAAVDWGTALAPVYELQRRGVPVHVWVDETRPRNQGASLTAWELGQQGIDHTVIVDNVGGHLMQHGLVDLCIVGADRVAANGDVCNKIGTYLKALAAIDNAVPFYAAMPHSTIDWELECGRLIPIEQRGAEEVTDISGLDSTGQLVSVRLTPAQSRVANYAFDITPARLVTALITERGCCPATQAALHALYAGPAKASADA